MFVAMGLLLVTSVLLGLLVAPILFLVVGLAVLVAVTWEATADR
jgi:hypothetical protein